MDFFVKRGFNVFSEESGFTKSFSSDSALTVVLDPVDGSTNASRGIPFSAISCALIRGDELLGGYVGELTNGSTYWSLRGEGAYWNGNQIHVQARERSLSKSVVAVNGYPPRHLGWGQFRAFGSAALELCMVASSQLDAFVDFSYSGLATWDYLAGVAIIEEAGAFAKVIDPQRLLRGDFFGGRRHIMAAADESLAGIICDSLPKMKISQP
ncbi:inositol monophosphatase family protein [Acidithrix sp. C25]|uniref:inositol monophosphatase family protein n=1 Tax=Acidithrix sp. C25 TaxID=1671482 RepID=UPI0020BFC047|nr:inositol monophosphatase family protein [Acidithrix sp. C25]